jgi:hypothetical protein
MAAVGGSLVLQVAAFSSPGLDSALGMEHLRGGAWALAGVAAVAVAAGADGARFAGHAGRRRGATPGVG